jgi:hypothetical protein
MEGSRLVVHLEFDLLIEAGFYYLGRRPIELMDAIGAKKEQEFNALVPNPLDPELLTTTDTFLVGGHTFVVTFGSDKRRKSLGIFRVMDIRP